MPKNKGLLVAAEDYDFIGREKEATALLVPAATMLGNLEAIYRLSNCYKRGKGTGTAANMALTAAWFQ